jgi:hypothetical protein
MRRKNRKKVGRQSQGLTLKTNNQPKENYIMDNKQMNVIATNAKALLREALKAEEAAEDVYDRAAYEYPGASDHSVIASRAVVEAAISLIYQLNAEG